MILVPPPSARTFEDVNLYRGCSVLIKNTRDRQREIVTIIDGAHEKLVIATKKGRKSPPNCPTCHSPRSDDAFWIGSNRSCIDCGQEYDIDGRSVDYIDMERRDKFLQKMRSR